MAKKKKSKTKRRPKLEPYPRLEIGPQQGPQSMFLGSTADIVLFGGGAGGGKTFGLLLEPLRHLANERFGGVIFRRNTTQVRNEGGLWDESASLYPKFGGRPREAALEWNFPSGFRMKFAHLEYEKSVYDWQGSQIPFIGFDELTHFSEKQFFYMLSRNRSTSGVPGYIRATCNPDCDSWVRKFIDWWIDERGFPIKERCGVVRWFIRHHDEIIWAGSKEELIEAYGDIQIPKSFTFIQSLLKDNQILMQKDPSYLSNLMALDNVERQRLLDGNWNIRPAAGMYFQKSWFPLVDAIPAGWIRCVRYWDRAATEPSQANKDPDWTVGLKLYKYPDGTWLIGDIERFRSKPLEVERRIKSMASLDGRRVEIFGEQDPGSAGVADAGNFIRMLQGFIVHVRKVTKDKVTRAKPVSAQCQAGNVKMLKAKWNDAFFPEVENFPSGAHDDQVDTLSGAFNEMAGGLSILDVL